MAAPDPKSVFSGMKDAKMRFGANYVRAGHYFMRLDAIKLDKNRKEDIFVAVELTTVKVLDDDQGRGHKIGEQTCHMLMKKNDSFLPNLKAMIAHVMDMRPEEIGEEHCIQICAPDQPLKGMVIELFNRTVMTKKNTAFTEVNYKREVPPAEALKLLDPAVIALYFPKDVLANAAAAMQSPG